MTSWLASWFLVGHSHSHVNDVVLFDSITSSHYMYTSSLQTPPHNLVQILSKVTDVVAVQPRHRDPPVPRQVDMRLLHQRLALLRADSRETDDGAPMRSAWRASFSHASPGLSSFHHLPEHANLVDDMVPVARRLQLFCQQLVQLLSHINDSVRHRGDILLPLSEQSIVCQNQGNLPIVPQTPHNP